MEYDEKRFKAVKDKLMAGGIKEAMAMAVEAKWTEEDFKMYFQYAHKELSIAWNQLMLKRKRAGLK